VELIALCSFAFLAGLIDSIVGGGGLIQIPALFIFMPGTAVATILGTNKLVSITGTSAAVVFYARKIKLNWLTLLPSAAVAFVFSFLGAKTVSLLSSDILRPVILLLLIVVAVYTFIKKDFGSQDVPKIKETRQKVYAIGIGASMGFYDGFFGAGTGSFLIFLFVEILGFNFLRASAVAKIINTSTNLAALIYFALNENILYHIALPMAVCNVTGSIVGAKLAIAKGSAFVRILFLVVVSAIIIKFAYDTFFGSK
jgi:hypothetical protein